MMTASFSTLLLAEVVRFTVFTALCHAWTWEAWGDRVTTSSSSLSLWLQQHHNITEYRKTGLDFQQCQALLGLVFCSWLGLIQDKIRMSKILVWSCQEFGCWGHLSPGGWLGGLVPRIIGTAKVLLTLNLDFGISDSSLTIFRVNTEMSLYSRNKCDQTLPRDGERS